MDAGGDLSLSLVELTQGTLTAAAALPAVAETEAIAYTLHIEADGAVNLYADGKRLASVAGTAGDLPASGLTATLTAPAANPELVRGHLGTEPRWTPPAEILTDVVDGVAVKGWLYGETA